MADIDTQRDRIDPSQETYSVGELIFWIIGIFSIPLVPILMVWFFTPWSGM